MSGTNTLNASRNAGEQSEEGEEGVSLLTPGQDELNKRSTNDNDSSERELCLASNFHSLRNAVYVWAHPAPVAQLDRATDF
jgi:hypothetical protein